MRLAAVAFCVSTLACTSAPRGDGGSYSLSCAPGAMWVGNVCAVATCSASTSLLPCALSDGGVGTCDDLVCGPSSSTWLSDPNNCGGVGVVCPTGFSCSHARCEDADGGLMECTRDLCGPGSECVAYWGCVPASCDGGSAGQVCIVGESFGSCCPSGCTDAGRDPNNCGGCGIQCPRGTNCLDGVCQSCSGLSQNAPCATDDGGYGFCCAGGCFGNGGNDAANCAFCGDVCPAGTACMGGFCAECTNENDPCPNGTNCVLYRYGASCLAASCGSSPDGALCAFLDADGVSQHGLCCAEACLSASDTQNCGGCGLSCGPGWACYGGTCSPEVQCAMAIHGTPCVLSNGVVGACCNGSCVDLNTDNANCGECGFGCPVGLDCHPQVTDMAPFASCGSNAAYQCDSTHPCAPGFACGSNGLCVHTSCADLDDGTACYDAQTLAQDYDGNCCGGVCTDTSNDNANCGVCGMACLGTACTEGSCEVEAQCNAQTPCPAGSACGFDGCVLATCAATSNGDECAGTSESDYSTCCNGSCVNLERDPANCGTCGSDCGLGVECYEGICLAVRSTDCSPPCLEGELCVPSFSFSSDESFPSACVSALCPAFSDAFCAMRDGGIGVCCPGAYGACIDLGSDPINCGNCGQPCFAGQTCTNGTCA